MYTFSMTGRNTAARALVATAATAGILAAGAAPALAAPADPLASLAPSGPQITGTLQAGEGNYEVAVDQVRNLAYTADPGSKTVWIIDMNTGTTTGSIPLDTAPYGVTYNQVTNTLYTSDTRDAQVTVIDAATRTVTGTIDLGARPHGIEADPIHNLVYVTLPRVEVPAADDDGASGDDAEPETISQVAVIDGAGGTVIDRVTTGKTPVQVGIDPLAGSYWVSTTGDDTITEYSTADNTELASIHTGPSPQNFYVDPLRNRIYLDNFGSDVVQVIDTAGNRVIGEIEVGDRPIGIDCNPVTAVCVVPHLTDSSKNDEGERVLDPNDPGRISVIDVNTFAKTGELHMGGVPLGVGTDILTGTTAVTDRNSGTVAIVRG